MSSHIIDRSRSSISSGGGGGSSTNIRIHGLSDLKDDRFNFAKKKSNIDPVLTMIEKIYRRAKLDTDALGSGCCSCVGLLDPTTNILVNFIICKDDAVLLEAGSKIQRSLDGLVAFLTSLFPYLPDAEGLAYVDAAGGDPLVAALLMIGSRGLTIESFITESAVEIALRSAAVAAQHPDPQRFVEGWKLVSVRLEDFAKLAEPGYSRGELIVQVLRLTKLLDGTPTGLHLKDAWKQANSRLKFNKLPLANTWGLIELINKYRLPSVRANKKRLLLSMIHGFYLKALGALPKQQLTDWYHGSLLMAGHCYGPLDPVSNIIVNTIWYDLTISKSKTLPLNMISTNCLWRIAARSLYGLVSFLLSRYPTLGVDHALQRLLEARANLSIADSVLQIVPKINPSRLRRPPQVTVFEAYAVAATAAFHPNPCAQQHFLATPGSVRNLLVISEMLSVHDGQPISKERFDCLLMLLKCPSSVGMSSPSEPEPRSVSKRMYVQIKQRKDMFWGQHERVCRMVTAVLDKFNETTVPNYRLHVICGVNELVDKEFSLDKEIRGYNPWTPYKYHYSHINFLATREGFPNSPATLFFAECSNHGTRHSWCVPIPLQPDAGILYKAVAEDDTNAEAGTDAGMHPGVGSSDAEAGDGIYPNAGTDAAINTLPCMNWRRGLGIRPEAARCIYCEHEGSRVLHPIVGSFHGRDDFEKLCDGGFYTNDLLIERKLGKVDWVHGVEDEAIYHDYCVRDEVLKQTCGDRQ